MSQSYPVSNAPTSLPEPESLGLSSAKWDGESCIELALSLLKETLRSKNADYRIGSEFSNFYFSADVAGIAPGDVMMAQIGIKLGRIKGILSTTDRDINHEALIDTYKDLAGYAVLLYALKLKEML